jgi:hypothetical protein
MATEQRVLPNCSRKIARRQPLARTIRDVRDNGSVRVLAWVLRNILHILRSTRRVQLARENVLFRKLELGSRLACHEMGSDRMDANSAQLTWLFVYAHRFLAALGIHAEHVLHPVAVDVCRVCVFLCYWDSPKEAEASISNLFFLTLVNYVIDIYVL